MIDDENEFSDFYEELYGDVEVQASSAINFNKPVDDLESDSDEEGLNIILNNNPANVDQVAVSNCEEDFNAVQRHPFAYESKPWRQPGADMTDYFNFGFDEDKWKRYCKDLQKGRIRHTGEISTSEHRQVEHSKYSINGESNIMRPDMRKGSNYINAEKLTLPKHSEYHPEYQEFNTDHNRSRFVDEGEYSSEGELSIKKDNGRHGRRKRREEEDEEESKWKNSFDRENRRSYDFKGQKFKSYILNKGRIRNRENLENCNRPKFKYPRRRYNSPPRRFHNCASTEFENLSWSSRYTPKRRLHCASSARYNGYDKRVTHDRFRHPMQNRARFNGKNRYEERRVVQCRCKLTREENRSGRVDRSCHVVRRGNCEWILRRRRDNLVDDVLKEKSTRQRSEGGKKMLEKTESKKLMSTSTETQMVLEQKAKLEENEKREEQLINNIEIRQENEALFEIEEGQIMPQDASESSIDDYISSWFRDPVSGDDQSGFGSSDLWMI